MFTGTWCVTFLPDHFAVIQHRNSVGRVALPCMRMPLRKIFAAAQTLATVVAADGLSLSSIRTSPMFGQIMLMIMRRVVVLPEPLG